MKTIAKLILSSSLVAAIGLSGCGKEATETDNTDKAVQTIKAPVETVSLGTIPLKAVVPGAVVPDQKAQIASRLMGYIKNLDVKVGQQVKKVNCFSPSTPVMSIARFCRRSRLTSKRKRL